MEPSHAAVLRDRLSGKDMDAGPDLAFHYIYLSGYWPGGHNATYGRDLAEGMLGPFDEKDIKVR